MNWLTKIVSTTLVVVTGCVIALVLTLFYMLATVLGKELDPITFGSMLAFSASCMGIAYKQFRAKRETAWALDEETGSPYKPPTADSMRPAPRSRYDVGAFRERTPMREIGTPVPQSASQPESVEERENAGQPVAARPLPPVVEEDGWEEEGE